MMGTTIVQSAQCVQSQQVLAHDDTCLWLHHVYVEYSLVRFAGTHNNVHET